MSQFGVVRVVDGHQVVGSGRLQVRFEGAGRTKQSMRESVDINHIMGRYLRSGNIDWVAKHDGRYADVQPQTFHEAMNVIAKANEMFADLPSAVRSRFVNSPEAFLRFMNDSKNIDEMRKLGLAKPAGPVAIEPVAARRAELEVDAKARLEIARAAIVAHVAPVHS